MNKQIEALKMSIETMYDAGFFIDGDVGYPIFFEKAIKACEEALAEAALNEMQTNAEELGLTYCKHGSDSACKECYMEQAEAEKQEPVAKGFIRTLVSVDKDGIETWKEEPFYTHPATWQSLSDDEIWGMLEQFGEMNSMEDFARAIDQKLKEKNHETT